MFLARYRQIGVSLERLQALMQGAPPEPLVRPAPLHLRHGPPPLPDLARTPSDRLARARGARPDATATRTPSAASRTST